MSRAFLIPFHSQFLHEITDQREEEEEEQQQQGRQSLSVQLEFKERRKRRMRMDAASERSIKQASGQVSQSSRSQGRRGEVISPVVEWFDEKVKSSQARSRDRMPLWGVLDNN